MKTKLFRFASSGALVAVLAINVLAEEKPESFVVDGEHFTIREIVDPKMNGMVAYHFSAPKDWRDSSEVRWNLMHIMRPMTVSASIENPANAEAFFFFHPLICGYLPGPRAAMREGQDGLDGISMRPMQPVPALAMFIQKNRSQYADLKFVGSRDLPDLAKALHANFATTQHGVGVKVTYTMDGKPVEEEFYAIHYYQLVQGESLWGLGCVHSFRAPAGTLEKRRNVFAAIPKSFLMTQDFIQRVMAVKQKLSANYAAVMRANAAEVAGARRRSAELTASENQFLANVDHSLVASRNARVASSAGGDGGSGGGATRTGNDAQDDYIRGVETMNDPDTGTSQHSFLQQYHWTDGYGNYRNSNDANYDPNHAENGNWQLMTPAQ
ncbi:MAG TPA: hypothetical protein VGO67_22660 [Verrucomicrobiae bacterium]|jgi:hypothetical protein